MVSVDRTAPEWAQKFARDVSAALETAGLGMFASLTVYDATGTLPDATKNTNKIILLSGGTFWLAKSDGAAWFYPDESPV